MSKTMVVNHILMIPFQKKHNYEEKQLIKELMKLPQKPLTIDIINNEITKSFGSKNRKRDIKHI